VSAVRPHPLPAHALLTRYSDNGAYADCFVADVAPGISHADYVTAFYTSWLFKLERLVLLCLVAKPSTDEQAGELARGERNDSPPGRWKPANRISCWYATTRERRALVDVPGHHR
jgi:hypothetical protein